MTTNYQKIYERLGYLFYAIAAADRVVSTAEVEKLKEMVRKLWVPAEDSMDEFGTDAAQYITISFDYLMNEGVDPEIAFEEFTNYYNEHKGVFTPELRRNIKYTAQALAKAFKGQNKREAELIAELESVLG
jgi:hypothetical protein